MRPFEEAVLGRKLATSLEFIAIGVADGDDFEFYGLT